MQFALFEIWICQPGMVWSHSQLSRKGKIFKRLNKGSDFFGIYIYLFLFSNILILASSVKETNEFLYKLGPSDIF